MSSDLSRKEYIRRIHRVQDYVEANIHRPLTLEELAAVAGFSRFHFHRIFKGITGESLFDHVNRIKLERAAFSLVFRPELTVTDIAYHFGFTDSAVFCRTFKNHFTLSPTRYRKQFSKNRKAPNKIPDYNGNQSNIQHGNREMGVQGEVNILKMDPMRVIYVRHTGTYQDLAVSISGLLEKLYGFADRQNLFIPAESRFLSIFHDNHEITGENRLRTSLCMTIPDNAALAETDEIGCMVIPAGDYAVGHFEIFQSEFSAAWNYMYDEWLSNSSLQPRASFPFEMYLNNPHEHPEGKHLVKIYLPVEPLGIV